MSRFVLSSLFAGVVLAIPLALPAAGLAPAAAALVPQAGYYRQQVGEVQVVALSDGTVPAEAQRLLKGIAPEAIAQRLAQSFQTDPVELSINAFLIVASERRILVDTGGGPYLGDHLGGQLLQSLARLGIRPEQIDDILITHAHPDHVGGLTSAGQRVFPRATVHLSREDAAFFLAQERPKGAPVRDPSYFQPALQSLTPYQEAGRLQTFGDGDQVLPGITASLAPGHTPGHSLYRLVSAGQSITFIGDLVHVTAVQLPLPRVTIEYDLDQPAAAAQRLKRFEALAMARELIAGPHIPFPGLGYLNRRDQGYEFVPVIYSSRNPTP